MSLSDDNLAKFGQYTRNNSSFSFCQENFKNLLFLLFFLLFSIVFVNPLNPFCGSIKQQLTSILFVVLKSQQVQATFRLVKPNKFRKMYFCATLYYYWSLGISRRTYRFALVRPCATPYIWRSAHQIFLKLGTKLHLGKTKQMFPGGDLLPKMPPFLAKMA